MLADRPRIATSARMRSTKHLFSGVSRIAHCEKGAILHIFSCNYADIVPGTEGTVCFSSGGEPFYIRTSVKMNFFRGVMGGQAAGPQPSGAETVRSQPG